MSGISNPMMRSAAEQALLGYGTAKLTGSKHPEKAAMYAGLGSMPFSFMKAQGAADAFNKKYYGDVDAKDLFKTQYVKPELEWSQRAMEGRPQSEWISKQIKPESWGITDPAAVQAFKDEGPMNAWDVIGGKGRTVPEMRNMDWTGQYKDVITGTEGAEKLVSTPMREWDPSESMYGTIGGGTDPIIPEVDFYSKIGKGEKNLLGQTLTKDEAYTDWTPTIASQTAGWYGGRPTAEEEWEDAKARRRKELAFMYGVPEDMLGGELQNPYYTGGGFWKDGGIAALQMDNGGAVDGPGGPKDDVIDAKLSDGEFVMTAKAVENLGGGDRMAGAKRMYNMMNQLDPQSETVGESVIGV